MQVTISEISAVEKRLAVAIPWPYVRDKLDAAYRDLSRGVAVPGFRKGKVPRAMLEKMFAARVEQDVMRDLVQESFFTAAEQHELRPVAEPVVDELQLKKGEPFQYSARVEVRSVVEPKDYEGLALARRPAAVSDDAVTSALEERRESLANYKAVEGRTTLGASDVVVLEAKGTLGERPFEDRGLFVDLARPKRSPVPGLAQALVGTPLDASGHEISFTLPTVEEEPTLAADLSGAKVTLAVTVREAHEKQVPTLDDEFAKDTGEAETLAELRDKTRQKLLSEDEKVAEDELKAELVKELLRRNSFPVAPALVERQLVASIQRARYGMAMRGMDPRAVPETRLRDELREAAHEDVRAAFLLDAIAAKEKVEATDADLEKRLAELAQRRSTSVPRLKAELQKEGRLESVRHQLREEKTLDLLLTRAKISEKAG